MSTAPTSFAVSFNEALLPGSVQPGDLLVNGIAATGVTLNGSNTTATFTFNTTPVTVQGLQNIAIAANGVTGVDNSGNLGFSSSFRYDALTLAVSSTGPAVGSTITIPPNSFNYDVTFDEPIDPATAATSNLTLSQGTVSALRFCQAIKRSDTRLQVSPRKGAGGLRTTSEDAQVRRTEERV